jgi:hypothetical protein
VPDVARVRPLRCVASPSLVPVRPSDRVKTDRRDAKKLVRLGRAGELALVALPTREQEGLRDLIRCREGSARPARQARAQRAAAPRIRLYGPQDSCAWGHLTTSPLPTLMLSSVCLVWLTPWGSDCSVVSSG